MLLDIDTNIWQGLFTFLAFRLKSSVVHDISICDEQMKLHYEDSFLYHFGIEPEYLFYANRKKNTINEMSSNRFYV